MGLIMIKKTILFLIVAVLFTAHSIAQESEFSYKKGDVIWVGNSNINSTNFYYYNSTLEEFISNRNTRISLSFKRISLISESSGIGVLGQMQMLVSDEYNLGLNYLGAGALYRKYVLTRSKLDVYAEGNTLVGYDMALADATGGTKSGGYRIRPAMKLGANLNLNKRTGLFLEIGPEWESGLKNFDFDSKALRVTIGVQFLNNK